MTTAMLSRARACGANGLALSSSVCEGARFYQACPLATILPRAGMALLMDLFSISPGLAGLVLPAGRRPRQHRPRGTGAILGAAEEQRLRPQEDLSGVGGEFFYWRGE